jgi:hypothetical protein
MTRPYRESIGITFRSVVSPSALSFLPRALRKRHREDPSIAFSGERTVDTNRPVVDRDPGVPVQCRLVFPGAKAEVEPDIASVDEEAPQNQ